MDAYSVTISSKGQLVIPAELREAMRIKPGMRFAVIRERNQIILRPIDGQLVNELRGMTAGGPSMTDALLKGRRGGDNRTD